MKAKKFLVPLTVAILALAFSWPWDNPNQEKNPKPKEPAKASASSAPQSKLPQKAASKTPVKNGLVEKKGVASAALSAADVKKIQDQIQNMIKVNEALKVRYANQAAKIQRISEQARIHERILKQLAAVDSRKSARGAMDAQEILKQEKIRLITEQTKRNQEILDNLQREKQEGVSQGKS